MSLRDAVLVTLIPCTNLSLRNACLRDLFRCETFCLRDVFSLRPCETSFLARPLGVLGDPFLAKRIAWETSFVVRGKTFCLRDAFVARLLGLVLARAFPACATSFLARSLHLARVFLCETSLPCETSFLARPFPCETLCLGAVFHCETLCLRDVFSLRDVFPCETLSLRRLCLRDLFRCETFCLRDVFPCETLRDPGRPWASCGRSQPTGFDTPSNLGEPIDEPFAGGVPCDAK